MPKEKTSFSTRYTIASHPLVFLSILFFIIYGIFLRFYNLSYLPASISYDELDHVVNGIAIQKTAKDFSGQHYFWELLPTQTHTSTAELSALWHALIPSSFFDIMTTARLPNALAGLVLTTMLTIFSWQVFKSKLVSSLVLVGLITSPWHIMLSRTAYEAPVALAWLSISLVVFWQSLSTKINKNKIILLGVSLLTLIFSFYTYHGYKMIFPFVYICLFFWNSPKFATQTKNYLTLLRQPKKLLSATWPLLIILLGWLVVFGIFMIRLNQGTYGHRDQEIILFNNSEISEVVNSRRQVSLDSHLKNIFVNKATVLLEVVSKKLLTAFNPELLFVTGADESFALGLWEHGFLYYLQLPLILIGVVWIFQKQPKNGAFLSLLLLVSLMPVVLHTNSSMTLRSGLFIPILIIFSALGAAQLIFKNYFGKKLVLTLLFLLFFASLANFHYFYFTRYPVQTIDTAIVRDRLLSSYLIHQASQSNSVPVYVATNEPFNSIRVFALFLNKFDKEQLLAWQKLLKNPNQDTYAYQNIIFTNNCRDVSFDNNALVLGYRDKVEDCELSALYDKSKVNREKEKQVTSSERYNLVSPRDSGTYYQIYNDRLCSQYNSPPFIGIRTARQFATEKLSTQNFCEQWVQLQKS